MGLDIILVLLNEYSYKDMVCVCVRVLTNTCYIIGPTKLTLCITVLINHFKKSEKISC